MHIPDEVQFVDVATSWRQLYDPASLECSNTSFFNQGWVSSVRPPSAGDKQLVENELARLLNNPIVENVQVANAQLFLAKVCAARPLCCSA